METILVALAAGASILVIVVFRLYRIARAPDPGPIVEPRSAAPPAWLYLLLAGMVIWLGQVVGALAVAVWLGAPGGGGGAGGAAGAQSDPDLRRIALASVGTYSGAALGFVCALALMPGLWSALGVRGSARDILRDLARGVIGFVIVFPILTAVGMLAAAAAHYLAPMFGVPPPSMLAHQTLALLAEPGTVAPVWWWVCTLAVVFGAPIVEETVYRGCLQGALRRYVEHITGRPITARWRWGVIVIVSLFFVLMHVPVVEWHALPTLLVLSLCFGAACERTGRLLVPITMHALFNAANIGLAML